MTSWNYLHGWLCRSVWVIVICSGYVFSYEPRNLNEPPPPSPWIRGPVNVVFHFDGIPIVKTINGKSVVETAADSPKHRYLYFNVDDDYAFGLDETVDLEIEYDSTVTGIIRLEYDSRYSKEKSYGRYHCPGEVEPDKSTRWSRHLYRLPRVRFSNRHHDKADFRISSPDGMVRISDIKIRRSLSSTSSGEPGTLKLRIVDPDTGKPTPVRIGLYDEKDGFQLPNEQAVPINLFYRTVRMDRSRIDHTWPSSNKYIFYIDGEYERRLRPGKYRLIAKKGIEYRFVDQWITIESGKTLNHDIVLEHWVNMAERGWYSGDVHVHIARKTPQENRAVWQLIQAEGLNLAGLSQMGNIQKTYHHQYAWGNEGKYRKNDCVILSGLEDPRTPHRGHTLMLNTRTMLRDHENYFLYHKVFDRAHEQGGLAGYAHLGIVFCASRGMAIDVPFGIVDFVEVLQKPPFRPMNWSAFLTLGYKLVPSAGSDFPYIGNPGNVRNYVYIPGPFSAQTWFEGFAQGHTFVTSGPILTFTVNGLPMGSELKVSSGAELNIEASAVVNPDIDQLATLELIVHGEPVKVVRATDENKSLRLTHTFKADESMWLAVKATCVKPSVAHTAPVYVMVDGKRFWKSSIVPDLIARQRQELDDLLTKPFDPWAEPWVIDQLHQQWKKQKPMIEKRVKKANLRYDHLLQMMKSQ